MYFVLWWTARLTVTVKLGNWCSYTKCDEAGLLSIQWGPVVIEWSHREAK